MNILLDTHTLLWTLYPRGRLSRSAKKLILNSENTSWVSAVSIWEISLKYAIGKIDLGEALPDQISEYALKAGLEMLDLNVTMAASFYKLPKEVHNDPFDRMLVWQAISKGWPLISNDKTLDVYKKYGLTRVW